MLLAGVPVMANALNATPITLDQGTQASRNFLERALRYSRLCVHTLMAVLAKEDDC